MGIFKDWFKTKYKIVPVYNAKNAICGYTVVSKNIIGWLPLPMFQSDDEGNVDSTDSIFKTYEDAITFLKHETTILTDEEISNS